MTSTFSGAEGAHQGDLPWRREGLRYNAYGPHLRRKFGFRVQKVSLDAGFTCPNVDGSKAVGGCVYCDNRSFSPSRRLPRLPIRQQLDEGISRLRRRYDCDHFLAYFQPATNTHAPVDRLRRAYEEAVVHPQVVALAIGTRPDCVPPRVLELLAALAQRTQLTVEYGIQSRHERSLQWMNRAHSHADSVDAVERSRGLGFEIGAHVILGLPGESLDDMIATVRELARLRVDLVKIHNLYAVKRTRLGEQYQRGEVSLLTRDEYVGALVEVLEWLPPETIVDRVTGDAPPDFLLGPAWCLDKAAVLRAVDAELSRRDSWQGKKCQQDVPQL